MAYHTELLNNTDRTVLDIIGQFPCASVRDVTRNANLSVHQVRRSISKLTDLQIIYEKRVEKVTPYYTVPLEIHANFVNLNFDPSDDTETTGKHGIAYRCTNTVLRAESHVGEVWLPKVRLQTFNIVERTEDSFAVAYFSNSIVRNHVQYSPNNYAFLKVSDAIRAYREGAEKKLKQAEENLASCKSLLIQADSLQDLYETGKLP